jgi:tetratricopeptide (TPR) repeat protein
MNAPSSQRKVGALHRPLPTRTSALILGAVALVALLAGGGWWLYPRLNSGPRDPEQVRAMIRKFLQKQTGQKEFKTEQAAALLTNATIWDPPPPVTNLVSQIITNLIGGTNRVSRQSVRQVLRNPPTPQNHITRHFRAQFDEASDYRTMYRILGEKLWVVDQLLEDPDPQRHGAGVLVAVEAGRAALNEACSPWLSARISEGYLWPQMAFTDTNNLRFNVDLLMDQAEKSFKEAGETNNLIASYQLLIAKAPTSSWADKARIRVAALLEDRGELAEALKYYKQVQNRSPRVNSRISSLETRIQRKQAKK